MNYDQKTGRITSELGSLFGVGYSGNGKGKNNPEMENVKGIGVIPKGSYHIGEPFLHSHMGRFAIPLIPFPENEMFGRSEFYIHGDSLIHPGEASKGCIVTPLTVRQEIADCTDKILKVV
jgi:hypothetical protein